MQTVAEFKIEYIQYLDAQGNATQAFPDFIDNALLTTLYKQMTLTRVLDNKAINLQRTGKMGTYPASTGHEASNIGIGYSMSKDDIFCPYYRDQAISLMRNIKMSEILSYWGGDERACDHPNNQNDFPPCIPIATQCLHAAGVAFALKYRNKKAAAVTTIGDGGTSKGDFYEAINVAGCWKLPVVFVSINNQWAISVPREKQTACQTIAQKAIAAGIEGIQVDGNDVIAVIVAMKHALNKAYNGEGPTLIETLTYRLCDHTTADDASRYRDKDEFKKAWEVEPIRRLAKYLESQGAWSKEKEAKLQAECTRVVEQAVATYMNQTPQKATDMIDYLFADIPEPLMEQRDEIEELSK
ncbi:MAG: pyruvate dehydrogenase (acetyl-transferring) E1 component subunit alpha [Coxiella sp. (in: Bacteria)]|nr:MAG: pyruvate dehydrogenase (acetyl-transferring) E1 component subunit alpha [Coxiella sp. (in: g-proteobacteria)]